ncbi:hypothetical protein [uncultured Variovorax sp.]|uniref:hypothetical protein n=1 Tax=uncultured Variovorax sp. TaxID=114708 RepID=UPI0025E12C09|nr:hypothetical protein [uncultured Variovorax sp.]
MGWFGSKAVAPLQLDALIAKPGDTVVLRSPSVLTSAQREELRVRLDARSAEAGVRFVLLEGAWEACVIGAPE